MMMVMMPISWLVLSNYNAVLSRCTAAGIAHYVLPADRAAVDLFNSFIARVKRHLHRLTGC